MARRARARGEGTLLGTPIAELGSRPLRGSGAQPLAERAYETIKGRILTFELPAGTLVSANDLAEEVGTSVTPVHVALKRLCLEGLCQVIPRTGYVVASVTLSDVQEVFGLRLALEPLAAELGMRRASDAELAAFREEVFRPLTPAPEQWEHMPYGTRVRLIGDGHDAFHLAVARLSGWDRLVTMIRELLTQGRRLTLISAAALPRPEQPQQVAPGPQGAHRTITEAILARDRDAAVRAVADHVRAGHRRVVEFLSSIPVDPLAAGGVPPTLE